MVSYDEAARTGEFAPRKCGVVVRYGNNRQYYFFGLDGPRLVLVKVDHESAFRVPDETVLAEQPFRCGVGKEIEFDVRCKGSKIIGAARVVSEESRVGPLGTAASKAAPAGTESAELSAEDDSFPAGKIALLADVPASFVRVMVTMEEDDVKRVKHLQDVLNDEEVALRRRNPQAVIWKKIETPGFGVGRNLRFGDLSGNGTPDILIPQVRVHGPKDQYSEVGCVTAVDVDGNIIWQSGTPDHDAWVLSNDVAVQVHDIDGDGRNEVVLCRDFRLQILDGATGEVKRSVSTPKSSPRNDKFERILGDSLFFADFSGNGVPREIVLKDRYWNFWVYDSRLELLWDGSCTTGHYPYACDIDGDGRDALFMGYSCYDWDGTLLWSLDDRLNEHSDGVAVLDMEVDGCSPVVFFAASDEGALFLTTEGEVLRHYRIGHVQNPAYGTFLPDSKDRSLVTINFWGNQGIIHFFNERGEICYSFEPLNFGSMCYPVNWKGDGQEYFIHSTNPAWGGMYDGLGRRAFSFPDDGHPDMCYAVVDLYGDSREEVVTWDQHRIWIYTQSDNPKDGVVPKRKNPLYNTSNYQLTISE